MNNYNVTVWYNSTYRKDKANRSPRLVRVPRSINLVYTSNLLHGYNVVLSHIYDTMLQIFLKAVVLINTVFISQCITASSFVVVLTLQVLQEKAILRMLYCYSLVTNISAKCNLQNFINNIYCKILATFLQGKKIKFTVTTVTTYVPFRVCLVKYSSISQQLQQQYLSYEKHIANYKKEKFSTGVKCVPTTCGRVIYANVV